jgi:hypothetical protein
MAQNNERGVSGVKAYLKVGLVYVSLIQGEAGERGAGARVPGTTGVELALNTGKPHFRLTSPLSTRLCPGPGFVLQGTVLQVLKLSHTTLNGSNALIGSNLFLQVNHLYLPIL